MSYKLFLDDVRNPEDCFGYVKAFGIRPDIYLGEWVIVRSFDEFRKYILKNGQPEIVSFDHDLADEHYDDSMYDKKGNYNELYGKFREKTGYDSAKWFIHYCKEVGFDLPVCICHSMNPVGRDNINSLFRGI